MKSYLSIGAGIAAALALAGCGGGGGGGTTAVTVAPTTRLKAPTVGQTWTYQATGSATFSGAAFPVSGTLTQTYGATTVAGATIQAVTAGSLTGAGQTIPFSAVELLGVDSNGNLDVVGLQETPTSTPHLLKKPIVLEPGVFANLLTYNDGTTTTDTNAPFNVTFQVTGSESLTVPAGTYQAWIVTSTQVSGTKTVAETAWYAPEVGTFVKAVLKATDSATPSQTITATVVLSSTNVTP